MATLAGLARALKGKSVDTTIEQIRKRHNQQPPSTITRSEWEDIDFLLAELDRIETKHESELDEACVEIGEIRGCDKCDLCEDHH